MKKTELVFFITSLLLLIGVAFTKWADEAATGLPSWAMPVVLVTGLAVVLSIGYAVRKASGVEQHRARDGLTLS